MEQKPKIRTFSALNRTLPVRKEITAKKNSRKRGIDIDAEESPAKKANIVDTMPRTGKARKKIEFFSKGGDCDNSECQSCNQKQLEYEILEEKYNNLKKMVQNFGRNVDRFRKITNNSKIEKRRVKKAI
ncbi:Oidioi.mRNA.OKI2018_I69.PAR.g12300.t1.cds [Oikopleura dioica]|uniref:Oidioi.mRNA.OKI2018_I69.PAR.g12300.t1.cds n=1 Tax=Oikopleura dioica TaxID=34765 RepID=A0ABN7S410_OIKDI|nr:Oidioi.mRNA.OKI2018_I69.PAR.g12300.t1.cds [Oikopleura dioica]